MVFLYCRYELGDITVTAVGTCDSSFRTNSFWLRPEEAWNNESYESDEYERGIVYYIGSDDKIVGVLLWNLPEDNASELAAAKLIRKCSRFPGTSSVMAIPVRERGIYANSLAEKDE